MRKFFILLTFSIQAFSADIDIEKVSEAMGHIIGKNLELLGLDLDLDAIVKGLKEESEGKNSPLNEDECVQAIAHLQEEKIFTISESDLQKADEISNGDQIKTDEDHSVSTSDSSKYR